MESREEKIQPTIIKGTSPKMILMTDDEDEDPRPVMSRKNSTTKSLSQVSIISSMLNDDEFKFLGGTKNQSHLYSTPRTDQQVTQNNKSVTTSMADLNPMSIDSISPELADSKTAASPSPIKEKSANPLEESMKNIQLLPPPTPMAQSHASTKQLHHKSYLRDRIPMIIWLGAIQLLLSIILVAIGGLVIARGASLAGCGSGVWSGAIAGVAGSFGVMGRIKKARTAFLACSLICVASSTLALALTGIGAARDSNLAQRDDTKWNAVSGGTGLIIILIAHFIVSMVSVYHSALKLCSGTTNDNVVIMENSDHSTLTKTNAEEYIQSIATDPNLRGMLYHNLLHRNMIMNSRSQKVPSEVTESHRSSMRRMPILLVPAELGPPPMMFPPGPPPAMYHPNLLPPGYVPATSPEPVHFMQPDLDYMYRSTRSTRPHGHQNQIIMDYGSERNEERKLRKAEKRQRREMERQAAFTYTGLDRAIAESYLEQQQAKSNYDSTARTAESNSTSSSEEDFSRDRRYGDVAM